MGEHEELKKGYAALTEQHARLAAAAALRCAWELARDALGAGWGEQYAFILAGVEGLAGGECGQQLAGQLDALWPEPPEEE